MDVPFEHDTITDAESTKGPNFSNFMMFFNYMKIFNKSCRNTFHRVHWMEYIYPSS